MENMDRELTFEELCEIVKPIAIEYGILRVSLFGSRARGDNRPDSDYDFCVRTPEDMGLFELGGFFGTLKDAIGTEIDLVCEEGIRDEFEREIRKDMILLYEE